MGVDERFQWSLDMQNRHALDIYREFWDVDEIIEVDKEGDEGDNAMQRLDFSGLDKYILTENDTQFQIAQRFRQPYYDDDAGWSDADFSLRIESYHDDHVEYDKLIENYQTRGASHPGVYGFGRTESGRQVALENGFTEFYLIDVDSFLQAHLGGELNIIDEAPNGDGSCGVYFRIDDIREHGCLIAEWDFTSVSMEMPDSPGNICAWTDGGEP